MSTTRARRLRRDSTRAERTLWRVLRSRSLQDVKFRRQVPIGPYIVDFVTFEAGLIIEVDGGHHADDGPDRTPYLEGQGFQIIRFWNSDVLTNLEGVATEIAWTLGRPFKLD